MVINRVRVLESGPHTPTHFFWEYPPPPRGKGARCVTRPNNGCEGDYGKEWKLAVDQIWDTSRLAGLVGVVTLAYVTRNQCSTSVKLIYILLSLFQASVSPPRSRSLALTRLLYSLADVFVRYHQLSVNNRLPVIRRRYRDALWLLGRFFTFARQRAHVIASCLSQTGRSEGSGTGSIKNSSRSRSPSLPQSLSTKKVLHSWQYHNRKIQTIDSCPFGFRFKEMNFRSTRNGSSWLPAYDPLLESERSRLVGRYKCPICRHVMALGDSEQSSRGRRFCPECISRSERYKKIHLITL